MKKSCKNKVLRSLFFFVMVITILPVLPINAATATYVILDDEMNPKNMYYMVYSSSIGNYYLNGQLIINNSILEVYGDNGISMRYRRENLMEANVPAGYLSNGTILYNTSDSSWYELKKGSSTPTKIGTGVYGFVLDKDTKFISKVICDKGVISVSQAMKGTTSNSSTFVEYDNNAKFFIERGSTIEILIHNEKTVALSNQDILTRNCSFVENMGFARKYEKMSLIMDDNGNCFGRRIGESTSYLLCNNASYFLIDSDGFITGIVNTNGNIILPKIRVNTLEPDTILKEEVIISNDTWTLKVDGYQKATYTFSNGTLKYHDTKITDNISQIYFGKDESGNYMVVIYTKDRQVVKTPINTTKLYGVYYDSVGIVAGSKTQIVKEVYGKNTNVKIPLSTTDSLFTLKNKAKKVKYYYEDGEKKHVLQLNGRRMYLDGYKMLSYVRSYNDMGFMDGKAVGINRKQSAKAAGKLYTYNLETYKKVGKVKSNIIRLTFYRQDGMVAQ